MFKNPFSFDGRIRRLEYGLSNVVYLLCLFVIAIVTELLGAEGSGLASFFALVIYIPLFWFLLAQGAKRCHDRGNPGIWQIIPFYGFWMLFADGDIGDNEYGEDPKGHKYTDNQDPFARDDIYDSDRTIRPED